MLLELLIVGQEQSLVQKMNTISFLLWREAKAKVVSTHQTWIDSIMKQADQLKIGLKAYRYLSEGIELATELGIQVDEAELVRNKLNRSYNLQPNNLGKLNQGWKNKTYQEKIRLRQDYNTKTTSV